MGSIVHRSVPTNLKWLPSCSHAHAFFQDRFKDVQVDSRCFSTLYILSQAMQLALHGSTGQSWVSHVGPPFSFFKKTIEIQPNNIAQFEK